MLVNLLYSAPHFPPESGSFPRDSSPGPLTQLVLEAGGRQLTVQDIFGTNPSSRRHQDPTNYTNQQFQFSTGTRRDNRLPREPRGKKTRHPSMMGFRRLT